MIIIILILIVIIYITLIFRIQSKESFYECELGDFPEVFFENKYKFNDILVENQRYNQKFNGRSTLQTNKPTTIRPTMTTYKPTTTIMPTSTITTLTTTAYKPTTPTITTLTTPTYKPTTPTITTLTTTAYKPTTPTITTLTTPTYKPTTPTITTLTTPTYKPTTPTTPPNFDLSWFLPPTIDQGKISNHQSLSLIYYVGSYYHALKNFGIMDQNGNINIQKMQETTNSFSSNSTIIDKYWEDNTHILNPLFNFFNTNGSCYTSGDASNMDGICITIDSEFYDIVNTTGTYSIDAFPIDPNNPAIYPTQYTDSEGNILYKVSRCSPELMAGTIKKPNIQPFLKKKSTLIYLDYEQQSDYCDSLDYPIQNMSALYNNLDNSQDILNTMKTYLNKGIPLIYGVVISKTVDNLNNPNTFFGQSRFSGKRINQEITSDSPVGHMVTICGYSDNLDSSTSTFTLMNSWGPTWGMNGFGYISYNLFFTKLSDGGITSFIAAFE